MSYRQIEQTIHISESKADELPVSVSGELTISDSTIGVDDVDDKADTVHQLTSDLEAAIDEVLEEHGVSDDA